MHGGAFNVREVIIGPSRSVIIFCFFFLMTRPPPSPPLFPPPPLSRPPYTVRVSPANNLEENTVRRRLLGLDVGARTIGMAVSDPLGITAHGLETVRRTNKRAV